jgi:hypothetical protein
MQKDITRKVKIIRIGIVDLIAGPIHSHAGVNAVHDEVGGEGAVVDFLVGEYGLDYLVVGGQEQVGEDELLDEEGFLGE